MSVPITPSRGEDAAAPQADDTASVREPETRTDTDERSWQQPAGAPAGTIVDPPRAEPRVIPAPDRATVVARQQERFGGIKVGSAFFGWLTATGMAVILLALLTAAGVAFSVATDTSVDDAVTESQNGTGTAQTVGLVGAIALLVVLLLAYYCGGYVAGRMARFNGIKQGLAVWLWSIIIAVVVAIITLVAGSQWDILEALDGFPRVPVTAESLTTTGILTAVVAAAITLGGAVLGGMAGMRYHRRVDRVGLGEDSVTR